MAKDKRPLSPHLQVYRLPMLALLSITHRASGVFLSMGALLIPVVLYTLAVEPEAYDCLHAHLSSWYGQGFLFLLSAALMFHLLNGIRHLVWDMGYNLEVRNAEISGIIVVVLSLVLTTAIWLLACISYYGGAA